MTICLDEPKILVVDDETFIRRALTKKFAAEGYICSEAADAAQAMVKIGEDRPDLVILDIMMPGRSGSEIVPEIQAAYPGIGIIMATAVVEPSIIIECMKNGADDYIAKPFDLNQVLESVNKVLEMKRLELKIKRYQGQLENTVEEQKIEIRKMFLHSIESLVSALEAKDEYTGGHSRRVTDVAVMIGKKMNLSSLQLEDLRWGALLHDVGKIAVDPAIQNKPDRLTPEEYRQMMTHSIVGAGIVKPVASQGVIEIIAHHHDRFDGRGLEQTSVDGDIPLGARIVAVADSIDAMTSCRPYRPSMASEKAIAEIKRCSGSQFDPEVVKAFLEVVGELDHA